MKKRILIAALSGTLALSVNARAEEKPAVSNQDLSYSLGMLVGERVLGRYESLDFAALMEGLKAQHSKSETRLTLDQALQNVQAQDQLNAEKAAQEAKAESERFLLDNAKVDGVKTTDSGLQYQVLEAGSGASPKASDTVTVHYEGTLIDGTVFDSSKQRGEPVSFQLDKVIPGWTEGLQLMKEGGKAKLFIPSDLAYGESGAGGSIPPHAALVFEVELIKVGGEE